MPFAHRQSIGSSCTDPIALAPLPSRAGGQESVVAGGLAFAGISDHHHVEGDRPAELVVTAYVHEPLDRGTHGCQRRACHHLDGLLARNAGTRSRRPPRQVAALPVETVAVRRPRSTV